MRPRWATGIRIRRARGRCAGRRGADERLLRYRGRAGTRFNELEHPHESTHDCGACGRRRAPSGDTVKPFTAPGNFTNRFSAPPAKGTAISPAPVKLERRGFPAPARRTPDRGPGVRYLLNQVVSERARVGEASTGETQARLLKPSTTAFCHARILRSCRRSAIRWDRKTSIGCSENG